MALSAKRESLSLWISLALLGNGVPENNEQQDDRLQRILAGFGFGKVGNLSYNSDYAPAKAPSLANNRFFLRKFLLILRFSLACSFRRWNI
ncbi:MAG: hypothetical protein CK551_09310 [Planctomycetaceae bacterium]|nr:MAG: hypothetical protein CK551_09310 [Planctomycetaceae bacterium]